MVMERPIGGPNILLDRFVDASSLSWCLPPFFHPTQRILLSSPRESASIKSLRVWGGGVTLGRHEDDDNDNNNNDNDEDEEHDELDFDHRSGEIFRKLGTVCRLPV